VGTGFSARTCATFKSGISSLIQGWCNAAWRAGVVRDLTGSHSLRPLENRCRIRHQSTNEEHQRGDAVWGMRWKDFAFSI
jgi:hypothetical protein